MRGTLRLVLLGAIAGLVWTGHVDGRGFGGYRGGGSFGGGFHSYGGGGYGGGYRGYSGGYRSYGGFDSSRGSYSGERSINSYSGWRGGGMSSSYDRSYTTNRGGSINTEGERGAAYGRNGGFAAGGERDTSITTAGGRTYDGDRDRGVAVGPYGRTIGGESRAGVATGPRGTVAGESRTIAAGQHFPTDFGLAKYSSVNVAGGAHSTTYWSHGAMNNRAVNVRNNFNYYNCFRPGWYNRYPGSWYAAGWAAGAAWATASWGAVDLFLGYANQVPYTYDYGSNIVYQNNNVYIGGQDAGTAQAFAQQATTLAETGQTAPATPEETWTPLGVFALVQGEEKTSNNIFQLAVNKDGIMRGNYYDGVMDTTTPIYGSVDKKTQRAAWTIGKKKDRVFEAGLYNLTQPEAPVLVHFGSDKTQQWLLVRVEQPKDSGQ